MGSGSYSRFTLVNATSDSCFGASPAVPSLPCARPHLHPRSPSSAGPHSGRHGGSAARARVCSRQECQAPHSPAGRRRVGDGGAAVPKPPTVVQNCGAARSPGLQPDLSGGCKGVAVGEDDRSGHRVSLTDDFGPLDRWTQAVCAPARGAPETGTSSRGRGAAQAQSAGGAGERRGRGGCAGRRAAGTAAPGPGRQGGWQSSPGLGSRVRWRLRQGGPEGSSHSETTHC